MTLQDNINAEWQRSEEQHERARVQDEIDREESGAESALLDARREREEREAAEIAHAAQTAFDLDLQNRLWWCIYGDPRDRHPALEGTAFSRLVACGRIDVIGVGS